MAKTQTLGTVLKQGTTVIGHLTSIGVPSPNKTEIDVTDFGGEALGDGMNGDSHGFLPLDGMIPP